MFVLFGPKVMPTETLVRHRGCLRAVAPAFPRRETPTCVDRGRAERRKGQQGSRKTQATTYRPGQHSLHFPPDETSPVHKRTLRGIVVASPGPSPTTRRLVGPSHTNRLRGGRLALEPCPPVPAAEGGRAPGTVESLLGPSSARTYHRTTHLEGRGGGVCCGASRKPYGWRVAGPRGEHTSSGTHAEGVMRELRAERDGAVVVFPPAYERESNYADSRNRKTREKGSSGKGKAAETKVKSVG